MCPKCFGSNKLNFEPSEEGQMLYFANFSLANRPLLKLENPGAFCYANAALQIIITPSITNFFASLPPPVNSPLLSTMRAFATSNPQQVSTLVWGHI